MLSATEAPVNLLAELRKLTGTGYAELKERIAQHRPVIMVPLFDNDFYESGAARLGAVLDLLENTGSSFTVYELAEGVRFETRNEKLSRITSEILRNTLREENPE